MAQFAAASSQHTGHDLTGYADLHAWSVRDFRSFWRLFAQQHADELGLAGDFDPVCVGDDCEHATFFPQLRLNYTAGVLNRVVAGDDAPAVRECHAERATTCMTRGQLRDRVARTALGLRRLGVQPGDRVVAVMRNDAHAIVVALAVAAIGAVLSTAAPDMGGQALLDRFAPLEPKGLIAHMAPRAFDSGAPLAQRMRELADALPSLRTVVAIDGEPPAAAHRRAITLAQLSAHEATVRADDEWPAFGFNHPLFILFSSGTTGRPKCIVHGAGGTLVEHVKEHRLHTDLRAGERMYFHTGCGWMMWNWQLSALASGVEIVTYDGPIDSVDRLWRIAADERVHVFGTSPGYLRMCEEAALRPSTLGLDALRAVLCTGAVLHDSQFDWITRNVKDVPVQSISGGTDIVGCFVLGHPDLPVLRGHAQCRSLGLDVQAWGDGGTAQGVGPLVCGNPFPSRPLGFWGDAQGRAFHAAYFAQHPGVWTHGDLIEFTPEGAARLHGRCDSIINVRGMKFAPAEVYRVLADVPGVRDAMLVQARLSEGAEPQLVLLVVPGEGTTWTAGLAARVRSRIAERLSGAHVPDRIADVAELPVTHSGKPSEAAARAAVADGPVNNLGALRNPGCLDAIRGHPVLRQTQSAQDREHGELPLAAWMRAAWAAHFGLPRVDDEDNFFELGGNSLLAARLLREVRSRTGRDLPLSSLLHAPTLRRFTQLVEGSAAAPAPGLVRMRAGQGRPLFLVHGLSGSVMECWPMVNALRSPRPVWGLQARGVDGEQPPPEDVIVMAAEYVAAIRDVQPRGPYALCGFSFGGVVAFEMARQLAQAGEAIEQLLLIDPYVHRDLTPLQRFAHLLALRSRRIAGTPVRELPRLMGGWLARALRGRASPDAAQPWPETQRRMHAALTRALDTYRPAPYDVGPVVFFRATLPLPGYFDPLPVWRDVAGGLLRVVRIPGEHLQLVRESALLLAARIDEALAEGVGRRQDSPVPVIPAKAGFR